MIQWRWNNYGLGFFSYNRTLELQEVKGCQTTASYIDMLRKALLIMSTWRKLDFPAGQCCNPHHS